jgi:hypothetical protein
MGAGQKKVRTFTEKRRKASSLCVSEEFAYVSSVSSLRASAASPLAEGIAVNTVKLT